MDFQYLIAPYPEEWLKLNDDQQREQDNMADEDTLIPFDPSLVDYDD